MYKVRRGSSPDLRAEETNPLNTPKDCLVFSRRSKLPPAKEEKVYMASVNASNFSIDHILGFVSNGKSASTSTANANASSWPSVGDLCPRPETYCNSYPVSQRTVPPHPYLLETPFPSMQYDYFGYASFNYYPFGFDQGRFQNGAGELFYVYFS